MGTTETELRYDAAMQRERVGETLEAIGDRVSPERMLERRKAAVGQRWQRTKEAVMGSPEYVEPAARRLADAKDSAQGAAEKAVERVQHAPQMVADQARGNPIVAGAVAFGIGMLVATVMPKSRTEQRIVEEAKPQLAQAGDELKQVGRELAAGAKDHAQEAAEELKSTGAEAASIVQEQAKDAAQTVTEQVKHD